MIIIHGSRRTAEGYRDAFTEFADLYNCIVLAPLFPVGILDVDDQHSYKYIRHPGLNYDDVLFHMISDVRKQFSRLRPKFLLHGFSGGGQFAHRYFYLNPEDLLAVSIGAPGTVTLLNKDRNWWPGIQNFEQIFGKRPNFDAMKKVGVQLVIGSEDIEIWDVLVKDTSPTWAKGANDSGENRRERLNALRKSLESHGICVQLNIIENVNHDGMAVLDEVRYYFGNVLENIKYD